MTFTEIVTEARRFVGASTTSFPIGDITQSANNALERVVSIIRKSEGRWQFDDNNNTDFPVGVTSLADGQQDYTLDVAHLSIERVEVKDENGSMIKLQPIDTADLYNQSLTSFMNTAGVPQYYDKTGNSILLYPKPNYSQNESLYVFYKRGPSYFETSDTNKVPGFNSLYHRLIPLWCAYDHALINTLANKKDLREEILVLEEELKESYSLRDRDDRIRLSAKRRFCR